jgi:hypothetical protein
LRAASHYLSTQSIDADLSQFASVSAATAYPLRVSPEEASVSCKAAPLRNHDFLLRRALRIKHPSRDEEVGKQKK